jgi:hypothetical protein
MAKQARKNKVFIDWSQNHQHKTTVAGLLGAGTRAPHRLHPADLGRGGGGRRRAPVRLHRGRGARPGRRARRPVRAGGDRASRSPTSIGPSSTADPHRGRRRFHSSATGSLIDPDDTRGGHRCPNPIPPKRPRTSSKTSPRRPPTRISRRSLPSAPTSRAQAVNAFATFDDPDLARDAVVALERAGDRRHPHLGARVRQLRCHRSGRRLGDGRHRRPGQRAVERDRWRRRQGAAIGAVAGRWVVPPSPSPSPAWAPRSEPASSRWPLVAPWPAPASAASPARCRARRPAWLGAGADRPRRRPGRGRRPQRRREAHDQGGRCARGHRAITVRSLDADGEASEGPEPSGASARAPGQEGPPIWRTQFGERAAKQSRHVHLADSEPFADLGLGEVLLEPQPNQLAFALG